MNSIYGIILLASLSLQVLAEETTTIEPKTEESNNRFVKILEGLGIDIPQDLSAAPSFLSSFFKQDEDEENGGGIFEKISKPLQGGTLTDKIVPVLPILKNLFAFAAVPMGLEALSLIALVPVMTRAVPGMIDYFFSSPKPQIQYRPMQQLMSNPYYQFAASNTRPSVVYPPPHMNIERPYPYRDWNSYNQEPTPNQRLYNYEKYKQPANNPNEKIMYVEKNKQKYYPIKYSHYPTYQEPIGFQNNINLKQEKIATKPSQPSRYQNDFNVNQKPTEFQPKLPNRYENYFNLNQESIKNRPKDPNKYENYKPTQEPVTTKPKLSNTYKNDPVDDPPKYKTKKPIKPDYSTNSNKANPYANIPIKYYNKDSKDGYFHVPVQFDNYHLLTANLSTDERPTKEMKDRLKNIADLTYKQVANRLNIQEDGDIEPFALETDDTEANNKYYKAPRKTKRKGVAFEATTDSSNYGLDEEVDQKYGSSGISYTEYDIGPLELAFKMNKS